MRMIVYDDYAALGESMCHGSTRRRSLRWSKDHGAHGEHFSYTASVAVKIVASIPVAGCMMIPDI